MLRHVTTKGHCVYIWYTVRIRIHMLNFLLANGLDSNAITTENTDRLVRNSAVRGKQCKKTALTQQLGCSNLGAKKGTTAGAWSFV